MKESLIIVEYYFRYLLSQDASAPEQIQVIETVLSCLVVIVIAISCFGKNSTDEYNFRTREKFVETPCLSKLSK